MSAVGSPNFKPARPPISPVSLRGDIAEVWRGEKVLGMVYQWTVHGSNGSWEGSANKYRLMESGGGEVEFRLYLHTSEGLVVMRAAGHIVGDPAADGEPHREQVLMKGTYLNVA